MHRVYGIRHHGPGSATRLRQALEAWEPDILLIEMPEDLAPALEFAGSAGLLPPVALLGYEPSQPRNAAYLPFAGFSPEWQALTYARETGIPVRPIDLSLGRMFGLKDEREDQLVLRSGASEEERRIRHDPLSYLARLAGYEDSERWWEVYFEQVPGPEKTFDIIEEAISALREAFRQEESRETLLREAHMRQGIREAINERHERIAVVCGAWHVPALAQVDRYGKSADAKSLRGLRKVKTTATWIPWSCDRLALRSGYRAGVVSPAWYELLFRDRDKAAIEWMSRASRLMQASGMESSPAHATEAVRLADTLSIMRRRQIPGLQELEDAALAVFCRGDAKRLEIIHTQLTIGDRQGKVPPEVPVVPLQRDLDRCIKTARLTRERNTTRKLVKELDFRKESNLKASHLLHRLQVLEIPWGSLQDISGNPLGSFRESWVLRWKDEFAIRIIEKGMLGNTVRQAAARALLKVAESGNDLGALTRATEKALYAHLPEIFDQLLLHTRNHAALSQDVALLLEGLPPLVRIFRYGDTRQSDTEAVDQLIHDLLPRIRISLPAAATNREEEASRELFHRVYESHHALGLMENGDLFDIWLGGLRELADRKGVNPLLQGLSTRLLFDKDASGLSETGQRFSQALSRASGPTFTAQWLEGFLYGSGMILLHQPTLWKMLDDWVNDLSLAQLPELLPLLRRAFAPFSRAERAHIMALARRGQPRAETREGESLHAENAASILPVLERILKPKEK